MQPVAGWIRLFLSVFFGLCVLRAIIWAQKTVAGAVRHRQQCLNKFLF